MINITNTKVACIGCGTMGGAIMRSLAKKIDAKHITVSAKDFDEAKTYARSTGCSAASSNIEAIKDADVVFIAVKPAFVAGVLQEMGENLNGKTLVSMAAGVKLSTIREVLSESGAKDVMLFRIMPNMPAACGEAMCAISTEEGNSFEAEKVRNQLNLACSLLETGGKVEQVPEKLMDCVTAVSGSGPAFVFMFIEAMADAAVKLGMPRSQAYTYAAQTVKGSACMALETGKHPAELKDAVCSPAGTTIAGVAALEKYGFRNSIIEAVTAAYDRSVELGKK